MTRKIVWSVKDIVHIGRNRQLNQFDANIVVSGRRGDGKSTLILKLLYKFPNFDPWKHQVYNREDVINLLRNQQFGLCWDDEAINSGYKRDFQSKGQQQLIKILTAYRDNYNIYASAIPNFFSLDKDLRDLYFLHLHVVERGLAVVHMPLMGRLYSQDPWDARTNAKIEESWSRRMLKDPTFQPPYHRLTTFRGYLFFSDVTPEQRKLYLEIKRTKRNESFTEEPKVEDKKSKRDEFLNRVYKLLVDHKLSRQGLYQICMMNDMRFTYVNDLLNKRLKDNGIFKTTKAFFVDIEGNTKEDIKKKISSIID